MCDTKIENWYDIFWRFYVIYYVMQIINEGVLKWQREINKVNMNQCFLYCETRMQDPKFNSGLDVQIFTKSGCKVQKSRDSGSSHFKDFLRSLLWQVLNYEIWNSKFKNIYVIIPIFFM